MTLVEILPAQTTEEERIGLIPVNDLGRFALNGSDFEQFAGLADVIDSRIGHVGIVGFELDGKRIEELTRHRENGTTVLSIVGGHKTRRGINDGPVDSFVRSKDYPGVTFFEHHHYYRRGAQETQSTPRPFDERTGQAISIILGRLFGPAVIASTKKQ